MIQLRSLLNESYADDESILFGRIISGGSDKAEQNSLWIRGVC